jgi:hypothetical protein
VIYRTVVKRKARGIFAALSEGDWPAATKDITDDVHNVFAGRERARRRAPLKGGVRT